MERMRAEEMFVTLATECLQARHPAGAWLVKHGHVGNVGMTDTALEAAIERLGVWLSERPEQAVGQG